MMSRTRNTSFPLLSKIFGCSVVLQTRCRMVVFPALARPMIRTRKHLVSFRTFSACLCCLLIFSAPWNSVLERDIFVAGMPKMVEVKKSDKRVGVSSLLLFGYTSAKGVHSTAVSSWTNEWLKSRSRTFLTYCIATGGMSIKAALLFLFLTSNVTRYAKTLRWHSSGLCYHTLHCG